jgi:hypothetical protein
MMPAPVAAPITPWWPYKRVCSRWVSQGPLPVHAASASPCARLACCGALPHAAVLCLGDGPQSPPCKGCPAPLLASVFASPLALLAAHLLRARGTAATPLRCCCLLLQPCAQPCQLRAVIREPAGWSQSFCLRARSHVPVCRFASCSRTLNVSIGCTVACDPARAKAPARGEGLVSSVSDGQSGLRTAPHPLH